MLVIVFCYSSGWDIGPNATNKADALIHHARYNCSLLDTVMHPDTKYITLVRDAASWYQSAIRFWPGQVKFQVRLMSLWKYRIILTHQSHTLTGRAQNEKLVLEFSPHGQILFKL